MAVVFPPTPTLYDTITDPDTSAVWMWDGVKWMHGSAGVGLAMQLSFMFAGQPASGAILNKPLTIAVAVMAGLEGTVAYAETLPAADAIFTLNQMVGTTPTEIGTITIDAVGGITLAGTGGTFAIGDVLQVVAPATQDTTLENVGISVFAPRV